MKEKLILKKKPLNGEDGYKVFSNRMKDEAVAQLDAMAKETNRSRNELIHLLLTYAMDHCEIK